MENTQVGPFLIINRLGTTRRQKVFRARQVEQDRDVALKFIKFPPHVDRDKAIDKIDREVKFLQELRHPNLARLYGAGLHEDKIFFASELVEGESLSAIMARRGRLAPDLAVDYASQICNLLQYIHQHELLHAKLTPEKVLIGNDGVVKITDLRINRSRRKRWDAVTTRRELDLAAYMAPEQHAEGATVKSDIYSLGVITYEMLTGKLPYAPDTMGRMNKRKQNEAAPSAAKIVMNCPVWLDKIVSQMLHPEARRRPHTTKAIGIAFDEIKKIDKNKKAAIAQVSGNFNPLTAGSDKTEARRLLGKKKKKRKEQAIPFYETIWFLVVCLMMVASVITFALWPTSTQKLFNRGVTQVESDEPSDWLDGIRNLKKVVARNNETYSDQASEYITLARRKNLLKRARANKKLSIQTKFEQGFVEAFQLETDGDLVNALTKYNQLKIEHQESTTQVHIMLELDDRIERLTNYLSLPTGLAELRKLLADIQKLTKKSELTQARKKLMAIVERFGEVPEYEEVVAETQSLTSELDAYLKTLSEQSDESSTSDTNASDSSNADDKDSVETESEK